MPTVVFLCVAVVALPFAPLLFAPFTVFEGWQLPLAVITALGADAPNVVGLVYESAFAPDQGESLKGLTSQPPAPPGAAAVRPDKQGLLWLDPAGLMKFFASDAAEAFTAAEIPVAFKLPAGTKRATIHIWNRFGKFIRTLLDEKNPPGGSRTVQWDRRDDSGKLVRDGVYIYRLTSDGDAESRVIVLR